MAAGRETETMAEGTASIVVAFRDRQVFSNVVRFCIVFSAYRLTKVKQRQQNQGQQKESGLGGAGGREGKGKGGKAEGEKEGEKEEEEEPTISMSKQHIPATACCQAVEC